MTPHVELSLPVPADLRDDLRPLLERVAEGTPWWTLDLATPFPRPELLAWVDGLGALVYRERLWVSDGRELVVIHAATAQQLCRLPLPPADDIVRALRGRSWNRARLEPFGPLDRRRLLFLVVGYDDTVLDAIPVVLDLRDLSLQPIASQEGARLSPFGQARRTPDPDVFLYVARVSAGHVFHLDDDLPVDLPHVLDLRSATLRYEPSPPPSGPCPDANPFNRLRDLSRAPLFVADGPSLVCTPEGATASARFTPARPFLDRQGPVMKAVRHGPYVVEGDLFTPDRFTVRLWKLPGLPDLLD